MIFRRPLTRVAAIAAASTLGLSGCSYLSPVQTHYFYQPAEGAVANFTVEDIDNPVGLRNFLVVVTDDGANLTGVVSNQSSMDQSVNIGIPQGSATHTVRVDVPAGQARDLSEEPIELSNLAAKPGDNLVLEVSVGSETQHVTVQVLDDSLPYLGDSER